MGIRRDVRVMAKGWRWGHRSVVPRSVELQAERVMQFPTDWARGTAARAARAAILGAGFSPLLAAEVDARVTGADLLDELDGPVIFIANHSSHLDTVLILTSLPPVWRNRVAVGAAADYFFDVWWRAAGTALAFNAFPVERAGSKRTAGRAKQLLADGWSLLVFPEGTRSKDGWVGEFKMGAAALAVERGAPVIPIGIVGSYQAMPKGRGWPAPGRPPVAVRFGSPVVPKRGESAEEFVVRMRTGLERTLSEQKATWWDSLRDGSVGNASSGPDASHWRRVWEASRPVEKPARVWPRR